MGSPMYSALFRHAKRNTVNVDDVKLVSRRSTALVIISFSVMVYGSRVKVGNKNAMMELCRAGGY